MTTGEGEHKCREYDIKEFVMLYESTLHVTEWRNSTNRYYYSIVVAMLAAVGFVFFFGYLQFEVTSKDSPSAVVLLIALLSTIGLSVFGILVTRTWINMLEYYKGLNDAKFTAMRKIDADNVFQFEYEIWHSLQTSGKLKKIPASKIEKTAPYAAGFAFGFVIIICLLLVVINRVQLIEIF